MEEKKLRMSVEARLKENGIELPKASTPAGNYVPYVINGDTVYVSGQIPMVAGEVDADLWAFLTPLIWMLSPLIWMSS
jgi:hypothetical protein